MTQRQRPAPSTPLDYALTYAARGWPVFPLHSVADGACSCGTATCGAVGKHPRTLRGRNDATTDTGIIREWWRKYPAANIGIATGELANGMHLVVLDIDPRHDGDDSLAQLEAQHGAIPATGRVVTGGGGEHYYFMAPDPMRSANGRWPGMDIKAAGGYVVAPPSSHASGRHYAEDASQPLASMLVDVPAWLRSASAAERAVPAGPVPDAVIEGGRNDAMASIAGSMVRRGLSAAAVYEALAVTNQERCRPPLGDAELRQIASGMVGRYAPSDPIQGGAGPWGCVGTAELAKPLDPIAWTCKGLRIAPGAVTMIAGYGYSRKTLAAQSLILSVAAGRPVWGVYGVTQGRALHLDYEQGRRLTQERYQRLARAMGLDLTDLPPDALTVAPLPRAYLDANDIYEQLIDLCSGMSVCLVDSFRAAFPTIDENSSDARSGLDVLARVSERTGCAFIIIHHARKKQVGPGAPVDVTDPKQIIRGSGAIFDAGQTTYVFTGDKGEPTRCHHVKDRLEGVELDPFGLDAIDITGPDGDPRWGLKVVHLEPEQLESASDTKRQAARDAAVTAAMRRIVDEVRASSGRLTRRELKAIVGMKTDTFDAAWASLVGADSLVNHGTSRAPEWRVPT